MSKTHPSPSKADQNAALSLKTRFRHMNFLEEPLTSIIAVSNPYAIDARVLDVCSALELSGSLWHRSLRRIS